MKKEVVVSPERQLEILESLKPQLGRFFEEKVFSWGLSSKDCRLVDEAGFGYAGIPIFGPKLLGEQPHIDIAVREEKYTGPRTPEGRPFRINLPAKIVGEISRTYGIGVWDFIIGSETVFALPTLTVRLGNVEALVPEPVGSVRAFADETILRYTEEEVGRHKLDEWFKKLLMIRDVSQTLRRLDVQQAAEEMIEKSRRRWGGQGWPWLSEELGESR